MLKAGASGPVVAMLQGVLKSGFGYAGAIDGIFGPATEAVVRQYQAECRAGGHGIVDESDLAGARGRGRRDAREPVRPDALGRDAQPAPPSSLERVDNVPGLRTDHPVDARDCRPAAAPSPRRRSWRQTVRRPRRCRSRRRSSDSAAGAREAGRTDLQHRMALVRLIDVDPCDPADNAVGRDSRDVWKALTALSVFAPNTPSTAPGSKPSAFRAVLEVAHSRIGRAHREHRFCHGRSSLSLATPCGSRTRPRSR